MKVKTKPSHCPTTNTLVCYSSLFGFFQHTIEERTNWICLSPRLRHKQHKTKQKQSKTIEASEFRSKRPLMTWDFAWAPVGDTVGRLPLEQSLLLARYARARIFFSPLLLQIGRFHSIQFLLKEQELGQTCEKAAAEIVLLWAFELSSFSSQNSSSIILAPLNSEHKIERESWPEAEWKRQSQMRVLDARATVFA